MIHGLWQTLKEDSSIMYQWFKGEEIKLKDDEDQEQRIQLAAFRLLAAVAMTFGALWAVHIITFVVTFPITVILKLALAVAFYAAAHDVFVMSQNSNEENFTPQKPKKPYLFGLFKGEEVSESDMARKFTHGTFLQPIWMWLYVKSNSHKKSL